MTFHNKPIRLIELFAGIGSQAKALKNLGIKFEHWYVCEFDGYAIDSYNAVHDTNFATSDVTKITADDLNIIDTDNYTYMLTYSFPCQDLSTMGLGKGMAKGSGTRSGLLWEVERLLNECESLPQVLVMENVPQVHGVKNKEHFDKWIEFLESKGYSNYWKDLNAKDYEIPQSRNRCFMVSILDGHPYTFPKPVELTYTLGDFLESNVDEKYYLSDTQIDKMKTHSFSAAKYENRVANPDGVIGTLLARDYKDPKCVEVSSDVVREPTELQKAVCNQAIENNLMKPYDIIDYSYSNARLDEIKTGKIKTKNSTNNQIANTITTNANCFGVCVPNEPKCIGGIGEKKSNGGRQWYLQDRIYDGEIATCVTPSLNPYYAISQSLRIRKLTPKECWRLMGFDDADFEKAERVCSNSQLYKQAGNSIVVNVLMAIFRELFIPKQTRSEWLDSLLNT